MMRYFNLHTHHNPAESDTVAIVNQYPQNFDENAEFFSIGIHPWYIDEKSFAVDLEMMELQMQMENCLAIGECGLDKKVAVPFEKQMEVFEAQLALAEKYKKPVIIHCVAAFSEVILAKRKMKIDVPMIIHGFSKNTTTAKQLLDHGFYLSFGKSMLLNPDLKMVFLSVPDSRIFLETDNMNIGITDLYARAADYKNSTVAEVQEVIATNVKKVFNLSL